MDPECIEWSGAVRIFGADTSWQRESWLRGLGSHIRSGRISTSERWPVMGAAFYPGQRAHVSHEIPAQWPDDCRRDGDYPLAVGVAAGR